MTIVARGSISLAQVAFAELLAQLSAFRLFVGGEATATAEEAAAHIFHDALPERPVGSAVYPLEVTRQYMPYGMVWTSNEGAGFVWQSDTLDVVRSSGRLVLRLTRESPAQYDEDQAAGDKDFINLIGDLGDAIIKAGRSGAGMDVWRVTLSAGPSRNPEEDRATEGSLQGAELLIEWGSQQ